MNLDGFRHRMPLRIGCLCALDVFAQIVGDPHREDPRGATRRAACARVRTWRDRNHTERTSYENYLQP